MELLIFLAVIAAIIFYLVSIYNHLVALKNRFKNGFSQIDVQLQRRHDLIPNLVESAKAFMSHEKETLEKVISARNQASQATSSAAKHPEDGAREGAQFVKDHIIRVTERAFDDFAGGEIDHAANRKMLGI